MMKQYPLIEAIFELRWGERSPGNFNFKQKDVDVFYQRLAMQASKHEYSIVETPNSDVPMIPHVAKYRYRKKENTWPCLQAGLGVFTINQILEGYEKNKFLEDIELGINIWRYSLSDSIDEVFDTLNLSLRYQNAFYDYNDKDAIERLRLALGINIDFPNPFYDLGNVVGIHMRVALKCKSPSHANAVIIINDAIIEGRKGLLVETAVESRFSNVVTNRELIKEQVQNWLNEAYDFQKNNFKILMDKYED